MGYEDVGYDDQDRLIECMWEELEDVRFEEDKDSRELYLAVDWKEFKKGEYREDIWKWFDERHSKGVNYLLNEYVFSYDR